MNAERLLREYERISDAPDAIARLRRFIIDLAVRGKLVPQDPKDEPAAELLRRIAEEKTRLLKAGEFREPSSFLRMDRHALPFVPATQWVWVRLIEIARPSYGFAFSSAKFNSVKRGKPLIRIRDISRRDTEAYFDGEYDQTYLVTSGDYLVGMDGDFNLRRWSGIEGLLNQRVMRINEWRCGVDPEFVKLPLQIILDHLHGETSLTTVKHLSAKQVNGIEIPLPPLAEQHRIAAKVDELMALCDRLEAQRAQREAVRDRLTTASLARLSAPEPETFPGAARFVLAALPDLTTRSDQIKRLRQTILNLAVRGKLVPQDPNDEPASELLKRTAKEKALLGIKIQPVPLQPEEAPFELPVGWSWSRIGEVCSKTGSGSTPRGGKEVYKPAGVPFLRSQNVYDDGLRLNDVAYIDIATHERMSGTHVSPGDLLLNITGGSMGRCCLVPANFTDANISQHVAIIRVALKGLESFLHRLVLSPYFQAFVFDEQTGAGRGGLPKNRMDMIAVALPPLAEQHRIVAKVDELMALCDRLEASLANGAKSRNRLLDALLAESLTPPESAAA